MSRPVGDTAPACATTTGPIPLLEGITFETASCGEGWVTTFTRAGEVIAVDRNKTLPWVDPRAPGRLAARVHEAAPLLVQKGIKDALRECFEEIRAAPDAGAIVSEPVARAISETAGVRIEMSDPPTYLIDLKGGQSLIFSSKEIAGRRPITLNEAWLSTHPREPLNANGQDFEKVIEYWLEIAEEVEPAGNASPWESIAETLQIMMSGITVYPTKEGLVRKGLYQEEGGPLWVPGRLVGRILKDAGKSECDSGFSKYLQTTEALVQPSKPIRVGGRQIRAWGFDPAFRPDDAEAVDFIDLDDEDGDRP